MHFFLVGPVDSCVCAPRFKSWYFVSKFQHNPNYMRKESSSYRIKRRLILWIFCMQHISNLLNWLESCLNVVASQETDYAVSNILKAWQWLITQPENCFVCWLLFKILLRPWNFYFIYVIIFVGSKGFLKMSDRYFVSCAWCGGWEFWEFLVCGGSSLCQ